ncbi:MAG: 3-dehydroquinate synthase [Alphaproteobacteria bacterium]|nr:3-dehydroquinate synthase [Alphaproteobacteria bacterium]
MGERLRVELGSRSYEIIVGERLLARAGTYVAQVARGNRAVIVTDENVGTLYLHRLMGALEEKGIGSLPIVLPPGEQTKCFAQAESLMETVLEHKPDRDTLIVALGGGVIGDLAGFAASILLRGLDYVQIPTTLLAQVDSSVGGKTAINSRHGKNLIGSFYQPRLVLADVSVLSSLPRRERLAGYSEVLKYALIDDAGFFDWLQEHAAEVLEGKAGALTRAILVSCRAKAAIVAEDERESGKRALLNFGHTFAHALEAETGYGDALLHGEAVAIGMSLAFALSVRMNLCPEEELLRVMRHLAQCGLPSSPLAVRANWDVEALMEHFSRDKKVRGESLTFVLTRGIGKAFVAHDVEKELVRQLLIEHLRPAPLDIAK